MGVSWSDDDADDEDEMLLDHFEHYEDDYDEDIKSTARKDSESVGSTLSSLEYPQLTSLKPNKKFTAKRKFGERCIPDPNINRDCAVVGKPDPSKLSVTFQTERPGPDNRKSFISSDPVTYEYSNPVDWNDRKSVDKLNSWRYQVLKRTIGQKRESRPPWTVTEQSKLIELMSAHLKSPQTGGHYSQINWHQIERDFNQFFQNRSHLKGEMTAETSYNVRGEDRVAKSRKLAMDRPHLPRSAGAIENQ
jgi:hypothetical protein